MSNLVLGLLVAAAAALGIILTVAYFHVARKLYSRDKAHPAVRRPTWRERRRTSDADAARLQNKEPQEPPRS